MCPRSQNCIKSAFSPELNVYIGLNCTIQQIFCFTVTSVCTYSKNDMGILHVNSVFTDQQKLRSSIIIKPLKSKSKHKTFFFFFHVYACIREKDIKKKIDSQCLAVYNCCLSYYAFKHIFVIYDKWWCFFYIKYIQMRGVHS